MIQDTVFSMASSLEKLDKGNSSQRPISHQLGNSEVSGRWNNKGIFVTKQTLPVEVLYTTRKAKAKAHFVLPEAELIYSS